MTIRSIFFSLLIGIIFIAGFGYVYQYIHSFPSITNTPSASLAANTSTAASVSTSTPGIGQSGKKINILIVPGHEPDNGGTNFGDVYERTLVVSIGQDLQQLLDTNSRYQPFITRDTQAWNPTFAAYFKNDWNQIIAWEEAAKVAMSTSATSSGGNISSEVHNDAAPDDALRLFGIVKWSNENNIDLMIHMHMNNYPDSPKTTAGKYSGLVMYMPASTLGNSAMSRPIAEAMFKRLSLYNPISNLPVESAGLEEDSDLIAMGAYNTSKVATMLIEYDYIYEPQFVNPQVRGIALKDLAYQTYLGLQDYYNGNSDVTVTSSYDPSTNVYAWTTPVVDANSNPEDIYALQTALIMDGDYPPAGDSKNDCPHSGTLGACTKGAIAAFQKKNDIVGEGIDGTKTFALLNAIYDNKN